MTFIEFEDSDRVYKKSLIRQIVDVLQVDIASKYEETVDDELVITDINTRKKYSVFKTGGLENPGEVVSSLYQTVFDQDHTYQTSNEMLDLTIGTFEGSSTVTDLNPTTDSSGKLVFPNDTLMMREKISIYKQYAQVLLGNAESSFHTPFEDDTDDTRINNALFINFKRLFVRDGLEKLQFSIKIHKSLDAQADPANPVDNIDTKISDTSEDFIVYSDAGATSNLNVSTISGHIGSLVDASGNKVGLIFYNKGIVVFDAEKIFTPTDVVKGSISSINDASGLISFQGSFIPDLWTKGSIDNVLDHIADTRFGRDNLSAIGFMNQTSINSTIYFCRVGPNELNFSSNPTYHDADGNIRCIQDKGDDPFSYVTTIGLHDASGELLAVAKTSRPIEKNPEVDLSISVRLDY